MAAAKLVILHQRVFATNRLIHYVCAILSIES